MVRCKNADLKLECSRNAVNAIAFRWFCSATRQPRPLINTRRTRKHKKKTNLEAWKFWRLKILQFWPKPVLIWFDMFHRPILATEVTWRHWTLDGSHHQPSKFGIQTYARMAQTAVFGGGFCSALAHRFFVRMVKREPPITLSTGIFLDVLLAYHHLRVFSAFHDCWHTVL